MSIDRACLQDLGTLGRLNIMANALPPFLMRQWTVDRMILQLHRLREMQVAVAVSDEQQHKGIAPTAFCQSMQHDKPIPLSSPS